LDTINFIDLLTNYFDTMNYKDLQTNYYDIT